MGVERDAELPVVRIEQIRPYASAVILEYSGEDFHACLATLMAQLRRLKLRPRVGRNAQLIASGLSSSDQLDQAGVADDGDAELEIDGFICEVTSPPSWATIDSQFTETSLDLIVAIRRRRLIAVHGDSSLLDAIQTWLDRPPLPGFRRIPEGVLNAALLTGEAKGLWLRGTHPRRTTKADTKNISGRRLQDALNPLEDSSYSMGSARAELPEGAAYGSLSGTIGATPRKSLVWISRTSDFGQFRNLLRDLLKLIENMLVTGTSLDSPYPWLATQVHGLADVSRAYELTTLSVNEIPRTAAWSDDALEAAMLLERVTFDIDGSEFGPNFVAEVNLDGIARGKISCTVRDEGAKTRLSFGWDPASGPRDGQAVRAILEALNHADLITIYYQTGQAVSAGKIWSTNLRDAPFPNWDWREFGDYDVQKEKPDKSGWQEMHDSIAEDHDRSLFSWVVENFGRDGWLTCDDGPGEIADFVEYGGDGSISLIHVKAANSVNPRRPINATAYEVVVSQATKNLGYLHTSRLIDALSSPNISHPACWYRGVRTDGRRDMLDYLGARPSQAKQTVFLVQPQMTESAYLRSTALDDNSPSRTRLKLLETMLNSARGTVTGLGADLYVMASR